MANEYQERDSIVISFQFKPPALALLSTIMMVSILVSLGQWQMFRAEEKREMLGQFAQNMEQPAALLPTQIEDLESWRYRKVYFEGTPMHDRQFLLDNQVRDRKAGFNVLTIFRLTDSRHVLVDRGWFGIEHGRDRLPDVAIEAKPMRLEGYIYVPYGEPFMIKGNAGETGWPRILAYLDFAKLSQYSGVPLPGFTIRLNQDMPNGYRRDWALPALSPDKHLGYAVQWFALAATVLAIFLLLNVKRKKKE